MDADRTFVEAFVATANSDGEETVLTVDHGPPLDVERVDILIEAGATLDVTVGTFVGQQRLAPLDDAVGGGGERFELGADARVTIGSTIRARWSNGTGTNRDVVVLVHGDREEDRQL